MLVGYFFWYVPLFIIMWPTSANTLKQKTESMAIQYNKEQCGLNDSSDEEFSESDEEAYNDYQTLNYFDLGAQNNIGVDRS